MDAAALTAALTNVKQNNHGFVKIKIPCVAWKIFFLNDC